MAAAPCSYSKTLLSSRIIHIRGIKNTYANVYNCINGLTLQRRQFVLKTAWSKTTPDLISIVSASRQDISKMSKAVPMFPKFSYSMGLVAIMYHQTGNGKSKMAASKFQLRVTQLVQHIVTKFQVLYPGFEGQAKQWHWFHYSMIKPEETESRKSKMAVFKLQIRVTQPAQ